MYSLTYNLVLQLAYTFYCNKTCIMYAFDRVKHSVLFSKLVRRGVPEYIVRLLFYWHEDMLCVSDGAIYYQIPFT